MDKIDIDGFTPQAFAAFQTFFFQPIRVEVVHSVKLPETTFGANEITPIVIRHQTAQEIFGKSIAVDICRLKQGYASGKSGTDCFFSGRWINRSVTSNSGIARQRPGAQTYLCHPLSRLSYGSCSHYVAAVV